MRSDTDIRADKQILFAKLTSIYSTKILAFKKLSFFWAFFCARMSWCSRNPPIFFHLSWQKRQLPLCNKSTHIIFFAKWDQQPVLGQYNHIVLTQYLVAYCTWQTCLLFYNKHEFSLVMWWTDDPKQKLLRKKNEDRNCNINAFVWKHLLTNASLQKHVMKQFMKHI